MTIPIRRVITGHDANGTAVVTMESAAPNARVRSASGLTSTLIWVEDDTPADNSGNTDKADRESGVAPPDGGSVFRVVEFPPEESGASFSNEAMKAEMGKTIEQWVVSGPTLQTKARGTYLQLFW